MFQQCPSFAVCLSVVGWFGSPVQIRCAHESASLASSSSSLTLLPCVSHAHQPEGGGMLLHSVANLNFVAQGTKVSVIVRRDRHTDTTSADWDACLHSYIKDYSQAFLHCQMLCRFIPWICWGQCCSLAVTYCCCISSALFECIGRALCNKVWYVRSVEALLAYILFYIHLWATQPPNIFSKHLPDVTSTSYVHIRCHCATCCPKLPREKHGQLIINL